MVEASNVKLEKVARELIVRSQALAVTAPWVVTVTGKLRPIVVVRAPYAPATKIIVGLPEVTCVRAVVKSWQANTSVVPQGAIPPDVDTYTAARIYGVHKSSKSRETAAADAEEGIWRRSRYKKKKRVQKYFKNLSHGLNSGHVTPAQGFSIN